MTDRSRRWTEPLARALAPADDTPRDVIGSILLNLAVLVAYSIAGLVVLVFGSAYRSRDLLHGYHIAAARACYRKQYPVHRVWLCGTALSCAFASRCAASDQH
jgi:hypothetical protein